MANELVVTFQSGSTIYATIRRESDAYAFNGSGFEVWSNVQANLNSYAVTMTDNLGDLYTGNMPAVASTNYRITYYKKAGAQFATTDVVVGTKSYFWNGVTLGPSTSLIPVQAYALCSLDDVKRYVGIASSDATYDDFFAQCINAATNRIEVLCGRHFAARTYKERVSGYGERRIMTKQYPINWVNRLSFGIYPAMSIAYQGGTNPPGPNASQALRAMINMVVDSYDGNGNAKAGSFRLQTVNASGVETVSTLDFATYPTIVTLVNAINAVGGGWVATSMSNGLTSDLNPIGGMSVLGRTQVITTPNIDIIEYWVDYERGMVQFVSTTLPFWTGWHDQSMDRFSDNRPFSPTAPAGYQNLFIEYNAGYTTGNIPNDLSMLCAQLAVSIFNRSSSNDNMKSETIGDRSWTLATGIEIQEAQERVLQRYAKVALGEY